MSDVRLALDQVRFTNKAFWRNPAAAFFTFAFPLMFLVIFTALLGNEQIPVAGTRVALSTFYVAQIAAFSIIRLPTRTWRSGSRSRVIRESSSGSWEALSRGGPTSRDASRIRS